MPDRRFSLNNSSFNENVGVSALSIYGLEVGCLNHTESGSKRQVWRPVFT
jgi:hypothetical protein